MSTSGPKYRLVGYTGPANAAVDHLRKLFDKHPFGNPIGTLRYQWGEPARSLLEEALKHSGHIEARGRVLAYLDHCEDASLGLWKVETPNRLGGVYTRRFKTLLEALEALDSSCGNEANEEEENDGNAADEACTKNFIRKPEGMPSMIIPNGVQLFRSYVENECPRGGVHAGEKDDPQSGRNAVPHSPRGHHRHDRQANRQGRRIQMTTQQDVIDFLARLPHFEKTPFYVFEAFVTNGDYIKIPDAIAADLKARFPELMYASPGWRWIHAEEVAVGLAPPFPPGWKVPLHDPRLPWKDLQHEQLSNAHVRAMHDFVTKPGAPVFHQDLPPIDDADPGHPGNLPGSRAGRMQAAFAEGRKGGSVVPTAEHRGGVLRSRGEILAQEIHIPPFPGADPWLKERDTIREVDCDKWNKEYEAGKGWSVGHPKDSPAEAVERGDWDVLRPANSLGQVLVRYHAGSPDHTWGGLRRILIRHSRKGPWAVDVGSYEKREEGLWDEEPRSLSWRPCRSPTTRPSPLTRRKPNAKPNTPPRCANLLRGRSLPRSCSWSSSSFSWPPNSGS